MLKPRKCLHRVALFALVVAGFLTSQATAQNWNPVASLPYRGTCGYFFNATEGVVGTGEYRSGLPAMIFYTNNGGASWQQSKLPPLKISGQVSEIVFSDRLTGWAGITEVAQNGGSGLYKTTDGGKSWTLHYPAMFIVSIVVNANGIYFTDRATIGNPGVYHSKDGGRTFNKEASSSSPLGLTALNANVLYVSAEATPTGPHLRTTDGGATWLTTNSTYEAWTAYSNSSTGSIYYASERNAQIPATKSAIMRSRDDGASFTPVWQGAPDDLTGGIGGSGRCPGILYAQGQGTGISGFLRSTDDGATWTKIGGPSTLYDTRFVVTGRGAVVYGFDRFGGVYKTTNGGDGTLTPKLTPNLTLTQIAPLPASAALCESVDFSVQLSLNNCDSLQVIGVEFPNDSLSELQVVTALSPARSFGNGLRQTITLRYSPRQIGLENQQVRFRLRQTDGFLEDTTISVVLKGLTYNRKIFSVLGSPTIDFGEQNICTGDSSREISVENIVCLPEKVTALRAIGTGFSLASSFKPFTLLPDQKRLFLLRFQPTAIGPASGKLIIESASGRDTIALTGNGIPGSRGLKLLSSNPQSSLCDSVEFTALLRNTSCGSVEIELMTIDAPFAIIAGGGAKVLPSDSSLVLTIRFSPNTTGQVTTPLRIRWKIGSEILDTVFDISATGLGGAPDVILSSNSLAFDSVSTCTELTLDLLLKSIGCSDLDITNASIVGSSTFTIRRMPASTILTGSTDTIRIRFAPSGATNEAGELVLQTSAGEKRIPLSGVGVLDEGKLSLSISGTQTLSLCDSGTFSLRIQNATCDEAIFDSVRSNSDPDFSLKFTSFTLPSGGSAALLGKILPTTGGARNATYLIYFHKSNGDVLTVTANVTTLVNAPPPLQFALESAQRESAVSEEVRYKISQLVTGDPTVRRVTVMIELNTDLLTPTDFQPSADYPGLRKVIRVFKDHVELELELNNPLVTGDLGELILTPFLSAELTTDLKLSSVKLFSADGEAVCIGAVPVTLGATSFALSPACGNTIISRVLKGTLDLRLESILPNPAHTEASLIISFSKAYDNTGRVEIYSADGRLEQNLPLRFNEYESRRTIPLTLTCASGARYIRIVTSQSVTMGKLMIDR